MTWARPFLLMLILAGVALALAVGPSMAFPSRLAAASLPEVARAGGAQLQGVASCAATACHNANGPLGSKGSEYTTWVLSDPHARAYRVLFEERSVRMAKHLRLANGRADQAELCLSCHVALNYSFRTAQAERFRLSDGVGCESCHGAAEKWLNTHYLDRPGKEGMTNTKDLRVRAEVCVRCHVGEGDRDVNHDLIAAGHPRLRFEYSAYLASYPGKHWKTQQDRTRYPDLEARAWVIGQLVSAEAALKLLSHRATRAQEENGTPWPELAEYNCAACHHNLTGKLEHPERGFGPWLAGSLPWGTWYYPLLPTLGRQMPGYESKDLLQRLNRMLRVRVPDEKQVADEASRTAEALREWLDHLHLETPENKQPMLKEHYQLLLAALAQDEQGLAAAKTATDRTPASWDSATQLYLGLAALRHGLSDLGDNRPGLKEALVSLRRHLEQAFPEEHDRLYNSPSRFNPAAIEKALRRIQEQLK